MLAIKACKFRALRSTYIKYLYYKYDVFVILSSYTDFVNEQAFNTSMVLTKGQFDLDLWMIDLNSCMGYLSALATRPTNVTKICS